MKISKSKLIVLCAACVIYNATAATVESSASSDQTKQATSVTNNINLLAYLDRVLTEAGFNTATKQYLVDLARGNLAKVSVSELPEKERLLKRNLYIYLQSLAELCKSPTACDLMKRQYYIAEQYNDPWDYVLSEEVLHSFKKQHIFNNLTVDDIKNAGDKFCQIWPFCEK